MKKVDEKSLLFFDFLGILYIIIIEKAFIWLNYGDG
jgi:hypothetical protein